MTSEEQKRWVDKITNATENWNERMKSEDLIWDEYSIYRIPAYMVTSENCNKYKPQLVSVGPYHNGEEHLKPMEEVKKRALVQLLNQSKKDFQDLLDCVKPKLKLLSEAYEGLNEEWKKKEDKFLKMLIVDGCFMIAVLQKNFSKYPLQDPIFSEGRQPTVVHFIKRDMLLLENQLPFLLIEILANIFQIIDLKGMLQNFFLPGVGLEVRFQKNRKHVLDILRSSMLHELSKPPLVDVHLSSNVGHSSVVVVVDNSSGGVDSSGDVDSGDGDSSGNDDPILIINTSHSATTLYHSYFEFIRSKSDALMDTTFDKYVVHLPTIVIDQSSDVFFLNLVSYEQLHFQDHLLMCSFFLLMAGLLIMPEDAKLLQDREIIQNHALSDTAVIKIIQDTTRGLLFTGNDRFCQLQQQLNDAYMKNKNSWRRKFNTWFSKLNERYLDSPWTIVKVLGVTIGLVATLLGAYYGYESYILSKNNSNMLLRFIGKLDASFSVKIIPCLERCLDRGLVFIDSILYSNSTWEI